jgi:hypothetical protein
MNYSAKNNTKPEDDFNKIGIKEAASFSKVPRLI